MIDGKKFPITSRLIIRNNKKLNKSNSFIITKIWTSGTPNLNNKTVGDFSLDSYTIIYDLDGKVLSKYETRDSRIFPLSLHIEKKSGSETLLTIENQKIYLSTWEKRVTKSDYYYYHPFGNCEVCGYNLINYVCQGDYCKNIAIAASGYPDDHFSESFLQGIIARIIDIATRVAIDHGCGSYCEYYDYLRCNILNIISTEQYFDYSMFDAFYELLEQSYFCSAIYIPNSYQLVIKHSTKFTGASGTIYCDNKFGQLSDLFYKRDYLIISSLEEHLYDSHGCGRSSVGENDNRCFGEHCYECGGSVDGLHLEICGPYTCCRDQKCLNPACGKCLSSTNPNCAICVCSKHKHEECPWCHNCYKDDDDEVCKTRSIAHSEICPKCECCPDCMGPCTEPWTGVGHANIIDEAFKGFTLAQIDYLNDGSKKVDTRQETVFSHMHGMRERGQSKEDALVAMRNFFIYNVNIFYNKSLTEKERFCALGEAIHMISDCYSPAHSNKTWIKNLFNWIKHIRDLRLFSNRSFNEAKQGTVIVVNKILNQFNSGKHNAGLIFDQ